MIKFIMSVCCINKYIKTMCVNLIVYKVEMSKRKLFSALHTLQLYTMKGDVIGREAARVNYLCDKDDDGDVFLLFRSEVEK